LKHLSKKCLKLWTKPYGTTFVVFSLLLTFKPNTPTMKTNLGILLIVAISLTACHNNPSSSSQDNANDTSVVSTTNDVTKTTTPDTAQFAASTMADSTFLDKAYSIGVFEVKIAKLAIQKSQDAKVKGLANMMIEDHAAMGKDVTAMMKKKNYDIPTALPADLKDKLDELSKLTGKDFDKKYVEINVMGHKEALDMFKGVSKSSHDADVKKLATDALPKLQMHEDHSLMVQGQLAS
jgi:putative membrane protein